MLQQAFEDPALFFVRFSRRICKHVLYSVEIPVLGEETCLTSQLSPSPSDRTLWTELWKRHSCCFYLFVNRLWFLTCPIYLPGYCVPQQELYALGKGHRGIVHFRLNIDSSESKEDIFSKQHPKVMIFMYFSLNGCNLITHYPRCKACLSSIFTVYILWKSRNIMRILMSLCSSPCNKRTVSCPVF